MEEINPEKLLIQIAGILDGLKLKYFITGGFAVSVWGRPRATFDIDLVIQLFKPDITSLSEALTKFSPEGYIDEEMMEEALARRGEFNFIDGNTGIKVDFWVLKDDDISKNQLERRCVKTISGQKVYFTSPEDLILNKLKWYEQSQSNRHLEDIESILKISGKELDMKYLQEWSVKLGFLETLNSLRQR